MKDPGPIFVLILASMAIYWIDQGLDKFGSEISLYPLECQHYSGGKCEDWEVRGKWRARVTGQRVTLLLPDGVIVPLTGCTVFDYQNWKCDFYDIHAGAISQGIIGNAMFVSWWHWQLYRVQYEVFGPIKG